MAKKRFLRRFSGIQTDARVDLGLSHEVSGDASVGGRTEWWRRVSATATIVNKNSNLHITTRNTTASEKGTCHPCQI
jgi:hypothetical protein